MHELSIAYSLVQAAEEAAVAANASEVTVVHLRLGQLSGVVLDALHFGWEIAVEGTRLAGARLEIEELPILVYCPTCAQTVQLASPQSFCCPHCTTPTPTVVQGRELELKSMEIVDDEPSA